MDYTVLIVTAIFILILLLKCTKIAKDNERFVSFRLGKYSGVRGPGIIFLLPLVDLIVRVDLDLNIPDWKLLSDVELESKLKSIVRDVHDNINRPIK
jgi:regulator of protease activity HflC (stomatin/prohibitin superfamily)